jgi:hypothetical protein
MAFVPTREVLEWSGKETDELLIDYMCRTSILLAELWAPQNEYSYEIICILFPTMR